MNFQSIRIIGEKCIISFFILKCTRLYTISQDFGNCCLPPSLKTMECSGNQITSFADAELPSVETLRCRDNKLTTLPRLPSVIYLDCSKRKLISLPNLPKVTELECGLNRLTALPDMPKVIKLNCRYNQITKPPDLPKVTIISFGWNKITEIPKRKPGVEIEYLGINNNVFIIFLINCESNYYNYSRVYASYTRANEVTPALLAYLYYIILNITKNHLYILTKSYFPPE